MSSACSGTSTSSTRCPPCYRWPGRPLRSAIGPACLNPFTTHPVEIAAQVAAFDVASQGRAFLGLARGSWLGELGIDQGNAPEAVAEAAAVVAALLNGDRSGVGGQRFSLPPGAALRQRPLRESVPLLIGTWGPVWPPSLGA